MVQELISSCHFDNSGFKSSGIALLVTSCISLRSSSKPASRISLFGRVFNSSDVRVTARQVGEVITFTGSASGTEPLTYAWKLDVGSWKEGPVVTHSYGLSGAYTVTMTATNACGEEAVQHRVTVAAECVAPAGADFTWSPLTPTVGVPVSFDGSVLTGTAPLTWTWAFGDGSTGSGATAAHTYVVVGLYTVTLTVDNPCGQEVAAHVVTVRSPGGLWRVFLPLVVRVSQHLP